MRKSVLALVVALLLVTSIFPVASAEEPCKAVMITVMSGGTYWGPIEDGWLAACEERGWQGEYWSPAVANNAAEMVELCETALTQGYKILAICPYPADMFSDVLTRAKEQGVVIVGVSADAPGYTQAVVGPDYYPMGYEQGKFMADAATAAGADHLSVLFISTNLDDSQKGQRDGWKQALLDHFTNGPVHFIADETCNSDASVAQDKLNAYYLTNPDMNACGATETYAMIGSGAFCTERGLQDQFFCLAPDLVEDNMKEIQAGTYCGGGELDVFNEGYQCAVVAEKLMNGEEVEYSTPVSQTFCSRQQVEGYPTVEEYAAQKGYSLK